MGWILLLLSLSSYCSGSRAQFTLTQPPFQSAPLGDPARLSCTMTGMTFGGFGWYQQKEGKGPQFVLWHKVSSGETTFGTEVSGNFSASADDPRKVAYLTINNVLTKDEATYYCGASYSSGSSYVWVFGGGTQLIVTDPNQPSLPPNVNLFPPSVEEKESKNKATLVCLVDGFRPPDITVTWLADGTAISTGVETTKPTKVNNNYVASSYLTLNPSEWESHPSYSCKVTHKGIDYTKSVGHSGSQCS